MYFQIFFLVLGLQVLVRALDDGLLRRLVGADIPAGVSEAAEGDLNVLQQEDTQNSKRCTVIISGSGQFKGFKCHENSSKTSDISAGSTNSAIGEEEEASRIRKRRQAQGPYNVQPLQKYESGPGYNDRGQAPQTMPKTSVSLQNYPMGPWYPKSGQMQYSETMPKTSVSLQNYPMGPWYPKSGQMQYPETMPKTSVSVQNYPMGPWYPKSGQMQNPQTLPGTSVPTQTYPLSWTFRHGQTSYNQTMPKLIEPVQTYPTLWTFTPGVGAYPITMPKITEITQTYPIPYNYKPNDAITMPKTTQTIESYPLSWPPRGYEQTMPKQSEITQTYPGPWTGNTQVNPQLLQGNGYARPPAFVGADGVQKYQEQPILMTKPGLMGNVLSGRRAMEARSGDLKFLVGDQGKTKENHETEAPGAGRLEGGAVAESSAKSNDTKTIGTTEDLPDNLVKEYDSVIIEGEVDSGRNNAPKGSNLGSGNQEQQRTVFPNMDAAPDVLVQPNLLLAKAPMEGSNVEQSSLTEPKGK